MYGKSSLILKFIDWSFSRKNIFWCVYIKYLQQCLHHTVYISFWFHTNNANDFAGPFQVKIHTTISNAKIIKAYVFCLSHRKGRTYRNSYQLILTFITTLKWFIGYHVKYSNSDCGTNLAEASKILSIIVTQFFQNQDTQHTQRSMRDQIAFSTACCSSLGWIVGVSC